MREIADLINLSDSNFLNLSPALVLAEWSKIVAKDVSDRKLGSIAAASADLHSMSSSLNQLISMVGGLQADLNEVKEERRDLATVCASQEAELVQQRQQHIQLLEDVSSLRQSKSRIQAQLNGLKSTFLDISVDSPMPTTSKKKRIRLEEEAEVGEVAVAVADSSNSIDIETNQQQLTPIIQSRAIATTFSKNSNSSTVLRPNRLLWNHQAHELSSSSNSNTAGTMFAPILSDLARRKALKRNKLSNTKIEKGTKYKTDIMYCLELADVVITEQQKEDLFSNDVSTIDAASKNIVIDMQKQLVAWDNSTWANELKLRLNGGSKMRDLVTGLARRVREHKKKCIERRGKTMQEIKYAEQPLVALQSIVNQSMGDPPAGNAFIDRYFPPDAGSTVGDDSGDGNEEEEVE